MKLTLTESFFAAIANLPGDVVKDYLQAIKQQAAGKSVILRSGAWPALIDCGLAVEDLLGAKSFPYATAHFEGLQTLETPKTKIPYEEVMDAYNHILHPPLPKVLALTQDRKSRIRSLWARFGDAQHFADYFRRVKQSPFLMGTQGEWKGCNFDWLINQKNALKVIEGNYHRK